MESTNDMKNTQTQRNTWFDQLINTIEVHELQLETNTASAEVTSLYNAVMNDNVEELADMSRKNSLKFFVGTMVRDYVNEIKNFTYKKLAFYIDNSKLMVWVEINDDDFESEKQFILAEAKVNTKYHSKGYDINSTIVENSDFIPVPNHYTLLK